MAILLNVTLFGPFSFSKTVMPPDRLRYDGRSDVVFGTADAVLPNNFPGDRLGPWRRLLRVSAGSDSLRPARAWRSCPGHRLSVQLDVHHNDRRTSDHG